MPQHRRKFIAMLSTMSVLLLSPTRIFAASQRIELNRFVADLKSEMQRNCQELNCEMATSYFDHLLDPVKIIAARQNDGHSSYEYFNADNLYIKISHIQNELQLVISNP